MTTTERFHVTRIDAQNRVFGHLTEQCAPGCESAEEMRIGDLDGGEQDADGEVVEVGGIYVISDDSGEGYFYRVRSEDSDG